MAERKIKLQKKEDYKKFYDSYPAVEISPEWICSACDQFYTFDCEDKEAHMREWREEKARESVRDDIERDFRKVGLGGRTKNRVGYKARKCFEDEYYGDFSLTLR